VKRVLPAYFVSFLCWEIAAQVFGVTVGWFIFSLTHRALDLGFVGLAMFLPVAVFALPAGVVADRFDRRGVLFAAVGLEFAACMTFLLLATHGIREIWPYFGDVVVLGTARAFGEVAERSILIALVPRDVYVVTSARYSSIRQIVIIGGPALGGALIALGTAIALTGTAALLVIVALGLTQLPRLIANAADEIASPTLRDALEGIRFIRSQPVILGAISLDLFAVLFGGATALLPVYADTILHVGPIGFGLLRSAPAAGALVSASILGRVPPRTNVGRTLLIAVAGFGLATLIFGLSHWFWLSVAMLACAGAADMVSVVIRNGLVQLNTPDGMRGRVNAVENVFIGASNELGAFESGMLAALVGPIAAVVIGGAGSLAVAAAWFGLFPKLRNARALTVEPTAG
jgi:MFS family permease